MILMEDKTIELDLKGEIEGIKDSKCIENIIYFYRNNDGHMECKACLYRLVAKIVHSIDMVYGSIAQTDKKSETLKFYRAMQNLGGECYKASNCAIGSISDMNEKKLIDDVALEINKFIPILKKQKRRLIKSTKSGLANDVSIKQLEEASKALKEARNLESGYQ